MTNARSPERGQYKFVHDLVREVAYSALAKRDRKARHLAAAHFFESLGTGEIVAGLASHYVAAHRNSPKGAEADAVARQARVALEAAAERAAALGAPDQALAFCEQALAFTDDAAETAALLEHAGDAAYAAGLEDTADTYLRRAIDSYRALGDRLSTARTTAALGEALLSDFRSAEALALLQLAAIEFGDLGAESSAAIGSQLARAHNFDDQNQEAIEVADQVLEIAEHADLAGIVADTLVTRGTALAFHGRTMDGLGVLRTASDLAEAHGFGATLLRAYINRSSIESTRDPRIGLELGRAALALGRRLGRRGDAEHALRNAARSALQTGDWPWALGEIEADLAEDLEGSHRMSLLEAALEFEALRGDPVADRLEEIRKLAGQSHDRNVLTTVASGEAFAALGAGRLAEARQPGGGWLCCLSSTGPMPCDSRLSSR